jgi:alpha-1,6-mannosyltransferase
MKSLHFTNSYHPLSGGIREFYHALLRHAPRANHYVRLVVPGPQAGVEDLNSHARIYHLRAPLSPLFDRRYRVLLPTEVLRPHGAVLNILNEEQPDLVEFCDKYSLLYLAGAIRKGWVRLTHRPVLVGLSCERMDDNVASYVGLGKMGQLFSSLYMRRIYMPQFDLHVANSHYTAGELSRQARKHRRDVHVLPMGVDMERFGPHLRSHKERQALLTRIGGHEQSRILVYAGRLSAEKNVRLLPETLHELEFGRHDYRLVIAGTGPLSNRLAADCERLAPGKTTFLQHLDRHAVAKLLANADAFIHPNPREPFGIAPLEAMASGLPLVAPPRGGVTTYANEATAWLAEPDAESFARRVQEIFAHPETRNQKTRRALEIARRYSWQRVTDQFFDAYAQFVSGSASSRRAG